MGPDILWMCLRCTVSTYCIHILYPHTVLCKGFSEIELFVVYIGKLTFCVGSDTYAESCPAELDMTEWKTDTSEKINNNCTNVEQRVWAEK